MNGLIILGIIFAFLYMAYKDVNDTPARKEPQEEPACQQAEEYVPRSIRPYPRKRSYRR